MAEGYLDDAEGAIGPELEGLLLSLGPEGGRQQDSQRQDQDGQQERRGGHNRAVATRRGTKQRKKISGVRLCADWCRQCVILKRKEKEITAKTLKKLSTDFACGTRWCVMMMATSSSFVRLWDIITKEEHTDSAFHAFRILPISQKRTLI
jgi:hypothetical protein